MSITIYVPCDASAASLGANRVAAAIVQEAQKRGIAIELIRNGSRGLFWLEPLVEVATNAGRIAYGPVQVSDVSSLFDANFLQGGAHNLALGLTEELDYLKKQQRLTFARVGKTDPVSLDDYVNNDGYRGLNNALNMAQQDIVKTVTDSGLRGRGGAAFPTGIKWNTVLNTPFVQKYIICNADEGDSGTFSDRMVMEDDPFVLIEGMTIAGLAVGATQGYIYLRVEYPHAHKALNTAIEKAYQAGYLGDDIRGSGKAFHLEVRLGAGAY
ncbi:MAG: formate dehydrogenase, partial [Methylococcaceae bacterium]